MTGLRTYAGVDLAAVRRRFGIDLAGPNGAAVAALEREGLLTVAGDRLVPTLDGLAVADTLALRFEIA